LLLLLIAAPLATVVPAAVATATATGVTTALAAITSLAAITTVAAALWVASTATTEAPEAAAATTTTTAEATSARAPLGSAVDADGSAIELNVIHSIDCSLCIGILTKAYEAKAPAATGVAILDDNRLLNGSELLELLAESHLIGMPGEAANKELGHGNG